MIGFLKIIMLLFSISVIGITAKNIGEENFLPTQYFFIENKGQITDQEKKYNPKCLFLLNSSNGIKVQLKKNGFSYELYSEIEKDQQLMIEDILPKKFSYSFNRIDVTFENCNTNAQLVPEDKVAFYFNYYTSNEFYRKTTNIKCYKKVTYSNI